MPYVLKNKHNEDESPHVFSGTIKFGSGEDCDLVIDSEEVLEFHGEIYHKGNEFRLVGSHAAFLQINHKEIESWPVVLNHGDIITIGDTDFYFHILPTSIKRSWKADFSSLFALFLLIMLIGFEVLVILWIPYQLKKNESWQLASMREEVKKDMDSLRKDTRNLNTGDNNNAKKFKGVLLSCQDRLAGYIREHGDFISLGQAREVKRNIYTLKGIVNKWDKYLNNYLKNNRLNPDPFISDICSKIDSKMNTNKNDYDYLTKINTRIQENK